MMSLGNLLKDSWYEGCNNLPQFINPPSLKQLQLTLSLVGEFATWQLFSSSHNVEKNVLTNGDH